MEAISSQIEVLVKFLIRIEGERGSLQGNCVFSSFKIIQPELFLCSDTQEHRGDGGGGIDLGKSVGIKESTGTFCFIIIA